MNENSDALQYASEELKDDFSIVTEAVYKQGNSLLHLNVCAKNNCELVLAALANSQSALNLCSDELRKGGLKKYIDELFELRNQFYLFLSAAVHRTKQLRSTKCRHLQQNSYLYFHLSKLTEESLKAIADFLGDPHGLLFMQLLTVAHERHFIL